MSSLEYKPAAELQLRRRLPSSSSSATPHRTPKKSGRNIPAHLLHLEPLSEAGKVLLAGPFTDGSGSLIVVDLPSREAVWEVVSRDPYVVNGIFNHV